MTQASQPAKWQTAWRTFWTTRPARERSLLRLGASVIGAALLWQLALAPALQTWQEAPAKQAALDAQTTRMHQLQAEARGLQPHTPLPRTTALQMLESSAAQWLGPQSRVSLQGEQVLITLKAAPAEGLSRWLNQARSQAQAQAVQAQLQRATPGNPEASASAAWNGTLVLNLR